MLRFSREPVLRENCNETGPPVFRNFHANPGCAKTAARLVHQCVAVFAQNLVCAKTATRLVHQCFAIFTQTRVVRKLQQHWSTSVAAIFARAKTATRLVHQCCRNFRAKFARKLRQDWSTSVSQFSRKPGLCEHCSNTGPPVLLQFSHVRKLRQHWSKCAKSATTLVRFARKLCQHVSTPVPHARKVQQHWGQNVRKVCQGLNTIGI